MLESEQRTYSLEENEASAIELRVAACRTSLDTLVDDNDVGDDAMIVISDWKKILDEAQALASTSALDGQLSDMLCKVTVGLLDQVVVDEIAPYPRAIMDSEKASYGRSQDFQLSDQLPGDYRDLRFHTQAEVDTLLAQRSTSYFASPTVKVAIDRIDQIDSAFHVVEVAQPVEFREAMTTLCKAKDLLSSKATWGISVPIRLNDLTGVMELKSVGDALSSSTSGLMDSVLPKQDIWYELLRAGYDLI